MTTPSLRSRVLLIDLLKALAAQLIVLHHLVWYELIIEPASIGYASIASIMTWLADNGRYAVPVFIVTSGFLAAQFLPMRGLPAGNTPIALIRERYFRLALPFASLLLLEIFCDALARQWMTHEGLDSPPQFFQFMAHVLMLQGVLGVESLSAGVWYVAIDFQLYALLVFLLWSGQKISTQFVPWTKETPYLGAGLVLLIALGSLFYFNRDPRWDTLALYFFGGYALGVGSGWAIRSEWRKPMLWFIAAVGLLALWVDFRLRIAIVLIIALALGSSRLRMGRWEVRVVHYLGGTSFALFLVHFPVYEFTSALFHNAGAGPEFGLLGLVLTWMLCLLVADLFHRWVELPLGRWHKRQWQRGSSLGK